VGPHIRHMVVATDDPAWLSREIATVRAGGQAPGWSFHFVQAPLSDNPSDNPSPELSYLHQRTGGVAAGAFFFAQMQALSQCEGLVAHFGSGVAYEVYAMMCFQHGALGPSAGAEAVYGVCPSIFDWGSWVPQMRRWTRGCDLLDLLDLLCTDVCVLMYVN